MAPAAGIGRRCAFVTRAAVLAATAAVPPFAAALAALATLAASGALWVGAAPAVATEACAGSGAGPCPYTSVQVIGQRAEGVLRFPEAVAVDTSGNVYVADQLSYVVQKFTASGTFETQWGSFGAGKGQFGPIGGIATDSAGDVYVVDSSHDRIEKFNAEGAFITAWGHRGTEVGDFNFGSSENYTQPPGGGIAVAGGYVYVADSGNNRIERFNLEGGEAMAWGTKGSEPGQFSYPRGVAANANEVIVSDDDNHRVEKFSPDGAFEAEAGSEGDGPGEFAFPYGVALDAAGEVFVADDSNDRVVKLTPQLKFAGAWGGYGSKPGQLAFPRALASDPAGDTYVADTANDRIEVFDANGDYLRTIGYSAHSPGVLTMPLGLAVDPAGGLLVSDTDGDRVEEFAPGSDAYAGQWTATGGAHAGFDAPAGIAVDPRGPVYVADVGDARLARMWGDGTYLSEIGGPQDTGGAALAGAGAVAVGGPDDLTYVADSDHNRILVYTAAGALVAKWGADAGEGAAGDGPGMFEHPEGVAVNAAGDVYVADTGNDRVVELSPEGEVLAEWGAPGEADGRFRAPTGVALDGDGDVYVVDSENNRVQEFSPGGRFLAKWGLRGIAAGDFSQPSAVAVGCEGDVYVLDTNNNRVERFTPAAAAPGDCVSASAWPPPLDVAPVLHVTLPSPGGVLARRALALTVSCQRGCRILVSGTLAPLGHPRQSVRLIAAARGLPAARAGHVRLLVTSSALRRLRAELRGARGLRARVKIVAAGPTGRRTVLSRSFLIAR